MKKGTHHRKETLKNYITTEKFVPVWHSASYVATLLIQSAEL